MANETGRIGWSNNVITGLEANPLMENVFGEFNKAILIGTIGELKLSHVYSGEKFYRTKVNVKRLSGRQDIIPIIVPEKIIKQEMLYKIAGKWVVVFGQYRSHNKADEKGSSHLELFLFAKNIEIYEDKKKAIEYVKELLRDCDYAGTITNNLVFFDGYLCKQPQFRKTPLETKISDFILAVNRSCGKSDYIPCIAWDEVAMWIKKLKVGTNLRLYGRMQSREYYKKTPDNKKGEWKIAYEISVIRVKQL